MKRKRSCTELMVDMILPLLVLTVILGIMSEAQIAEADSVIAEADRFIAEYESRITADDMVLKNENEPQQEEKMWVNYNGSYGNCYTYEGYFLITCEGSEQLKWKESHEWCYDNEGFARYQGYYIIAARPYFGEIGDPVIFCLENGLELRCIIGDYKADDPNAIMYGHVLEGYLNVIEFCVSEDWYDGHCNPGTHDCHPEWKSRVLYARKGRTK